MAPDPQDRNADSALKIADVVELTGVSRELIHHYLRQGLLPASEVKGKYGDHQVRLLHLVRALRDEHHLPLDDIRRVFEAFEYDPDRLEMLVLAEPLARRLTELASGRALAFSPELSRDDLIAACGISSERLEVYLDQRVVEPIREEGRERFTSYDASTIGLCEAGATMGIPFEVFRTIASYMRTSFELEAGEIFASLGTADRSADALLGEVFLRRELVSSLTQNLLQAHIQRFLGGLLLRGDARRERLGVVFRPSEAFVRRHGLRDELDRRRDRITGSPEELRAWLEAAELLIHVGRHHEAAFASEQARERFGERTDVLADHGRALALSGDLDRGEALLRRVCARGDAPRGARIDLALTLFVRGAPDQAEIRALVDGALRGDAGRADPHVACFGAWLLTALPPVYRDADRGLRLLTEALEGIERGACPLPDVPGAADRYRINAAYLLWEALGRLRPDGSGPRRAALRERVFHLDPRCDLAERIYLADEADDERDDR